MIPNCVHPLSRAWTQPNNTEIEIDEHHAIMEKEAFDKLLEYSASIPTGVYAGKMWKAHIGSKWFLRWYENMDDNKCSINTRLILDLPKENER